MQPRRGTKHWRALVSWGSLAGSKVRRGQRANMRSDSDPANSYGQTNLAAISLSSKILSLSRCTMPSFLWVAQYTARPVVRP